MISLSRQCCLIGFTHRTSFKIGVSPLTLLLLYQLSLCHFLNPLHIISTNLRSIFTESRFHLKALLLLIEAAPHPFISSHEITAVQSLLQAPLLSFLAVSNTSTVTSSTGELGCLKVIHEGLEIAFFQTWLY